MSTIAVKRNENNIEISCDSKIHINTILQDNFFKNKIKIGQKSNMTFGFVGELYYKDIFEDYIYNRKVDEGEDLFTEVSLLNSSFYKFIKDNFPQEENKNEKEKFSYFFLLIIKNRIFVINCLKVNEIEDYYAIGSGSDFSLPALMLGKNTKEAVEIASELDLYTGGKIHTFKIDNT